MMSACLKIYKTMNTKKIMFTGAALAVVLSAAAFGAGCQKQPTQTTEAPKPLVKVTVRNANETKTLKQDLEYPATVLAEQEAKIVAKTNGTAQDTSFKVGDQVKLGSQLVKIDDVNSASQTTGFDSGQVKQAQLAAEQARTSYEMARTNYLNLLQSSGKDLQQLEIAREQAETGKSNIGSTTEETLKSADLAYQTAKIAVEQAKLALDNRQASALQSATDTETNAGLTANSAVDTCNTVLVALNAIAELDNPNDGNLAYHRYLGILDGTSLNAAKSSYHIALNAINDYRKTDFPDLNTRLDRSLEAITKTKMLADDMKTVMDNTMPSSALPQSSAAGPSISGYQAQVAGYQTQANGLLQQLTGTKQALTNVKLNNDSSLDALNKGYELAQQQEKIAAQNLENLKAGNKTQNDNATFGAEAARNQYSASKIKLETQVAVSKSQMDMAEIQYRNATVSLQNLIDVHRVITPIDGVITKKSVENGDTISAGQILAVVSTPDRLKIQFYVDQESLSALTAGMDVTVLDDGKDIPATIWSVTPQADAVTRRFLVEARPKDGQTAKSLVLGSITTVRVTIAKTAKDGAFLLPLSAVDVAPAGTSIYLVKDGKATKAGVIIDKVEGENVEVSGDIPADAAIIIDGNKLVREGEQVSINQ